MIDTRTYSTHRRNVCCSISDVMDVGQPCVFYKTTSQLAGATEERTVKFADIPYAIPNRMTVLLTTDMLPGYDLAKSLFNE